MKFLNSLFYALPWITPCVWLFVIGGSYKVLKLKRSKNGYKNLKKSLSIPDRLLKLRFIELSKCAKGYQKYFIVMTYVGYFLAFALLVIWITSQYTGEFKQLFRAYMYIKCYLIELPAFVFTVFNVARPKSGIGLDWRFIEENNDTP